METEQLITAQLADCESFANQEHEKHEALSKYIATAYCDLFELAWLPMSEKQAIDVMVNHIKELRTKAGITEWPYTIK